MTNPVCGKLSGAVICTRHRYHSVGQQSQVEAAASHPAAYERAAVDPSARRAGPVYGPLQARNRGNGQQVVLAALSFGAPPKVTSEKMKAIRRLRDR